MLQVDEINQAGSNRRMGRKLLQVRQGDPLKIQRLLQLEQDAEDVVRRVSRAIPQRAPSYAQDNVKALYSLQACLCSPHLQKTFEIAQKRSLKDQTRPPPAARCPFGMTLRHFH